MASSDGLALHVSLPAIRLGGRAILGAARLDVAAGRLTALLGPSGVGKSTLLRLLAGLLPLPPGARVTTGDGRPLQGRVAWMGQQDLLLPWLDLIGNVALGGGPPPPISTAPARSSPPSGWPGGRAPGRPSCPAACGSAPPSPAR
ncbi:ATP-binding cassette domain-containing protein [Teichococcus aerofrigidensis]